MFKFVICLAFAAIFALGDAQISCGGYLTATYSPQDLTSPSYPLAYPNDLNCVWVISGLSATDQVEIQFGILDMEAGGDFLKVRDGNNANAKILLLPLTGYVNRTYNFVSSYGSLYISFTSDDSVVGTGWSSQFRIVPIADTTCGGNLVMGTAYQYFSSPGYPVQYPNNSYCVWTLTAPAGKQVLLTILHYQLEPCCDNVVVKRGTTQSSAIIGYIFGASHTDRHYLSSDGILVVRFRSDESGTFQGFEAKARAVTVTGTTSTPSPPFNIACDENLVAPSIGHGNFTSPDFPNEHPPGVSCSWVITSTPGTKVHLWFGYVNTEKCCDWIKVRDGSTGTSTKLALISGNDNQFFSYVSTSNVIRVEFDSDDTYNKRGFRAYYEVYKPGHFTSTSKAGQSLIASSSPQYFSSPGFPHKNYPTSVQLVWTIVAPFATQIKITFLAIITEKSYDKITVYDGVSSFSRVIVRFSGKFHDIYAVQTSSNRARVTLKSDSTENQAGFRAMYIAVGK